jgi:hypothetical protein
MSGLYEVKMMFYVSQNRGEVSSSTIFQACASWTVIIRLVVSQCCGYSSI